MRARRHPFDQDYIECRVSDASIREIIGNDSNHYLVVVDGEPLPPGDWDGTNPQQDSIVWITPLPQGDDIGNVLGLIATIALFAVAGPVGKFLGGKLIGGKSFWTGLTYAAGALAINALFPPPIPNLSGAEARRELRAISGSQNRYATYVPIPEIAGRHRVYPPYAAKPYTEIVGDDQYFNALFCLGLGEYQVSAAKIGETLLTNYDGVELEQTTDPDWVSISEDAFDISLDDPSDPGSPTTTATRTTDVDVEFISVDFIAPGGLIYTRRDGKRRAVEIDFTVEYRAAGSSDPWVNVIGTTSGGFDWIGWSRGTNQVLGGSGAALPDHVGPITISTANPAHFRLTERTINAVRFGMKWPVPEGQYDVRVTRTRLSTEGVVFDGTEAQLEQYLQFFKWTVLRSHNTDTDAVNLPAGTATFLKLRIKANDQLTGIIERFSVLAERMLRTWDKVGQSFTAPVVTRDPAWFFLNVLTGVGNPRAVTSETTRIWLDDIADWATANAAAGRYYDRILETETSVYEELSRCAAAGRAAPVLRDARHTIVRESQGTTPVGVLTARNMREFSSSRTFITIPHAFRVRFISEDANYEEDEIIVYDDGFDSSNATLFETIRLEGITDPDLAWKFGRYHLAQVRLRPERYQCVVDFEHLTFIRGDQLLIQQDVLLFGVGTGRIAQKQGDLIIFDERFTIEPGVAYAANIRSINAQGSVSVYNSDLEADPGSSVQRFRLVSDNADIAVGDLAIIGVKNQETIPVKVLGIEPRENLAATVYFVDAAPEILTADSGPIPAYNPNITLVRRPEELQPPLPVITDVSSESNLNVVQGTGDRVGRLIVSVRVETFEGLGIESLQARIRVSNASQDSPWLVLPEVGARSGSISTSEVEFEETYDIQVRSISTYRVPSDWSASTQHQVGQSTIAPPPIDGLTVTAGAGFILVEADLSTIDIIDAARLEIAYGTVDDRDDAGTLTRVVALPQKLASVAEVAQEIQFDDTTERFFWARLVDLYENAGEWLPSAAVGGLAQTPGAGGGGSDGKSSIVAQVYQRAASAPSTPTADDGSYNFTTRTLTPPSGWSTTPPASDGNPLYVSTGIFEIVGTTGEDTTVTWTAPAILVVDGSDGSDGTDGADGAPGDDGLSVAELLIFRREASAPSTPTGGEYDFGTQVLTPPAGWSTTVPAGSDPAYVSTAVAAVVGQTGVDNSFTWSGPVIAFQDGADGADGNNGADGTDGQAVDIIFRRSAAQPSTPAPSSGTPTDWFTDVNSVPAGADPLWSSVGTRAGGVTNFTWQTPVKIEGEDGADGTDGADGADSIVSQLTNPSVVVSADDLGENYSLSNAGGTHEVSEGAVDRTSSATHSIVGSATKNGLTISVNSSGVYSLSGASWTTDEETFTLRAVYGGVTLDKTYSIAKAKNGAGACGFGAMTSNTVEATATGPATVTAGVRINPNGDIEIFETGSWVKETTWIGGCPNTAYECRVTGVTGEPFSSSPGSDGSWFSNDNMRTWTLTSTFDVSNSFTLEIRRTADSNVGLSRSRGLSIVIE